MDEDHLSSASKLEFSGADDIIHCMFFFQAAGPATQAALALQPNQRTAEVADLYENEDLHQSVPGHMVRVRAQADRPWSWMIGGDLKCDLHLPGLESKCVEIFIAGFEDDDTDEELSFLLQRSDQTKVHLLDPLSPYQESYEMLKHPRRCLQSPKVLIIEQYKFIVYLPRLSEPQRRSQRHLLRLAKRMEPAAQISHENLHRLDFAEIGAYGKVYKRIDWSTGRFYALKVIDTAKKLEDGKPHHVEQEIAALEGMRHLNVIHSVPYKKPPGDEDASILMSFYKDTLTSALKHDKLSSHQMHDIMSQLLEGLQYLHYERVLVHRDIKGNNVLLCFKDDGSIIAKISDLGLSTLLIEGGTASSGGGNDYYSAPEVFIRRHKLITTASDLFSIGVMYINMLQPEKWQRAARKCRPEDLSNGVWASRLRHIILKQSLNGLQIWLAATLEWESAARPTAFELFTAVSAFCAGRPVPNIKDVFALRPGRAGNPTVGHTAKPDYQRIRWPNLPAVRARRKKRISENDPRFIPEKPRAAKRTSECQEQDHEVDFGPKRRKIRPIDTKERLPDNSTSHEQLGKRPVRRRTASPWRRNYHSSSDNSASSSASAFYRDSFDFRAPEVPLVPAVLPDSSTTGYPFTCWDIVWDSVRSFCHWLSKSAERPAKHKQLMDGEPPSKTVLATSFPQASKIKSEFAEGSDS